MTPQSVKAIHYRFLCAGFLAGALVAQPAPVSAAVPGDEHWSGEFGWPGTSNTVLAIAVNQGRVYAGGFVTSGLLTNTTLNVWDGNQWSTIGQFSGTTVALYDLAFVGSTLYAAGTFTNVNGLAASGLARWDGNSWSSLGLKGAALGLAADGNDLYVAGVFTNAGSVVMTNIGRWDGNAWYALGDGLGAPGGGGNARTVVATNGTVYVGGLFTNSGPHAVTNLAVWNGSSWSQVGGGVNNQVYGLALRGTDLYAGGTFSQAGSTPASFIARWDGGNWSALGGGVTGGANSGVNSLAILHNAVCVAGAFTTAGGISALNFATWNGSAWAAAGNGLSATGYRVISAGTKVYVGGSFLAAGSGIMNQIASWDGNAWKALGVSGRIGGLQTTVRAITSDGINLYVGGSFTYAGQTNASRIGRYDGATWRSFGTGLNSNVAAVAVLGTNIYAGGDFTGGEGGPFAYHVARWDGGQWVPLNNAAFGKVSALAVRGNDLFVAGYFGVTTGSNTTASWLARWDGTNFWDVVAFPPFTSYAFYLDGIGYTAMAIQDTNIYLSGHFSLDQCDDALTICTNCDNVMRFDGTYGRVMGTGLNSNASAITIVGTNVYFAGPFTAAGGVPANHIAKWDGNGWAGVDGGVVGSGTISALAAIGTNVYAGGSFTNLGGVPANHIAKWDGTTWSALGSGTTFTGTAGPVLALTAVGQDLYVGGTFRGAGGKPCYYLGRWNETLNFNLPPIQLAGRMNNPAGSFQFTITTVGVPAYVIERSTNLTLWIPLLTNSVTPYQVIDLTAPGTPRGFYRAHSLP